MPQRITKTGKILPTPVSFTQVRGPRAGKAVIPETKRATKPPNRNRSKRPKPTVPPPAAATTPAAATPAAPQTPGQNVEKVKPKPCRGCLTSSIQMAAKDLASCILRLALANERLKGQEARQLVGDIYSRVVGLADTLDFQRLIQLAEEEAKAAKEGKKP